jgi:predicted RNA-binding protein
MCLATAYLNKGGDEPILRDIAHIRFDGKSVEMETLFGEEKVIPGRTLEVDFSTSKITLDVPTIEGNSSQSDKA